MINPLDSFKNSLLKSITVMGKKFTFNPTKSFKSNNLLDLLVEGLVSVENVNLSNFDGIKEDIENGLTYEQAVKKEIESWDIEIVNILVNKLVEFIKNQKIIDFKNYPDLRLYWRVRKIFSKEEVDNFSDIDWQWCAYNLQQDDIEKDEFDNRALEKRKPWYSVELYNHINKEKQKKESENNDKKLMIQKLMEKNNVDMSKYEIELVDAEEEDIPTIIEE